ncbi:MAG: hypothetical protein MK105_00065 [Crocinitomicaceae bacterium]|nr:hypothetical protein [Crocinitomicaceae bacterium]
MKDIDLIQELNSISQTHTLQRNDIDDIMIEFAGRIIQSLKIERMSVWLFRESSKDIVSMGEYDSRVAKFDKDTVVPASEYSKYLKVLRKSSILYIENMLEDPVVSEFKEGYTIPNEIISRLDVPLKFEGKVIGYMSFEKTGDIPKTFDTKEIFYIHSLSLVFASNLEARKRRALQSHLDHELKEKEILLKEIHHRVKNNLSVVSSLIRLQSSKAKDSYHKHLLEDCWGKIQSIGDIHDIVYQSKSFSSVNVKVYFQRLINEILEFYDETRPNVKLHLDISEFNLAMKNLIPLGLIVNEIITNSLKHAFDEKSKGEIFFTLMGYQKEFKLNIRDNGCGFHQENQTDGLGLEILSGLAEQIDAKYNFDNIENGVSFNLQAPIN